MHQCWRLHVHRQVLDQVVVPLCAELGLPLSLRMGTRRAVNPVLRLAGDGVGPAQLDALRGLCAANPRTKVLVTVLSPADQHEATVLCPLLHTAYCILHAAYCMLHAACCILHAAYCILLAAYCLLRTACCVLGH